MSLGAAKNTFNLDMLSKLFQIIAKVQFKSQQEQMQSAVEPRQSHFERLLSNLKAKMQIAFTNSDQVMRFWDIG